MLILAIDTSTQATSVCLAAQSGVVASARLGRGQRHGEFTATAIRFCLDRAGMTATDVTGVAVSLGPGAYTGMRVGIATAQTFAHAGGLPVVGLASLDVVAFAARHTRRRIYSVIDARRRELFWAAYRQSPGGVQRIGEYSVGAPATLVSDIEASGEEVLAIGDGAVQHTAEIESVGATVGSWSTAHPEAAFLAELALPRFEREETQRPSDLHPIYLRKADARINWERRGALRGGPA